MNTQNQVHTCPYCGAEIPSPDTAFCPYCNSELIDLSRERTDQKIAKVQAAQKHLLSLPKKIAFRISCIVFVLLLIIILLISTDAFDKLNTYRMEKDTERYTNAMKAAYEKEDWDALYDIIITDSSNALNSPAYFMYRSAWYVNVFPEKFDIAYQKGDIETMEFIFNTIAQDYDSYSNDLYYTYYITDPSIEENVEKEYIREKNILDSMKGDTSK